MPTCIYILFIVCSKPKRTTQTSTITATDNNVNDNEPNVEDLISYVTKQISNMSNYDNITAFVQTIAASARHVCIHYNNILT